MTDASSRQRFVNPPGVETISPEALGEFGVTADNRLYWRGKPVSTEHRVTLRSTERLLAIMVSVAALISAVTHVVTLFE